MFHAKIKKKEKNSDVNLETDHYYRLKFLNSDFKLWLVSQMSNIGNNVILNV